MKEGIIVDTALTAPYGYAYVLVNSII